MDFEKLIHINELFTMLRLTPGRRVVAMRKIRALLEPRNLPAVITYIERAIAHDHDAREVYLAWTGRDDGQFRFTPRLPQIDNRLDHTITSIRDMSLAQIKGALPGDPLIFQVEGFLTALFPAGVQAITSLPYSEEIVAAEALLAKLRGPLAETAADLGLVRQIARMEELVVAYRAEIDASARTVSFDQVRYATLRGHAYMLEVIAMILGTYHDSDNPAHVTARRELLTPIFEQIEIVRAYRRTRRKLSDVNPDTGEDEAPTGDEAATDSPAAEDIEADAQ